MSITRAIRTFDHARGAASPLGATIVDGGVNFSLFSRTATGVSLELFDAEGDAAPSRVVTFDPDLHRTYHYWHAWVPGVEAGQLYGYRVSGPADPGRGLCFDPSCLLLDPYGREVVVPAGYTRERNLPPAVRTATAMKSVVVDAAGYDWEGDAPLRRSSARTIVYELHVRGFTRHESSGVAEERRGTYAGLIDKIPYLKALGITAVELLPVFQFDALAGPEGLGNYWGYQPVAFFAPHRAYSARQDRQGPVTEFRDMVKALHRAGIEVILDVVFNHTAEGGADGPVISLKGIDAPTYYLLEPSRARFADYTGCGNTLNANHPVVRRLVVDSLRYWVTEMHVDGFRFDLASILSRDDTGQPLPSPPVLWDIETDPALAGTKLIAEAWDAAGLYQVGSFVGDAWKEWNGRFRDDCRDFLRGAPGAAGRFADRFLGSPNVYGHEGREVEQSVNFITCHDGFTLNDLVSYDRKHNEANGEDNRDGADDNRSWNCGVEGPTSDPDVESLRNRQVKNGLAVTLLALGVPMLLMGDEVRRTQRGNNNAYCLDDETSWFDWARVHDHADVHRFVSLLAARRAQRDATHERDRLSLSQVVAAATKAWHGVRLNQPDWSEHSRVIAFTAEMADRLRVHVMLNSSPDTLAFEMWQPDAIPWRRWIDTALPTPDDIMDWVDAPRVPGPAYEAGARSVVVLFAAPSASR